MIIEVSTRDVDPLRRTLSESAMADLELARDAVGVNEQGAAADAIERALSILRVLRAVQAETLCVAAPDPAQLRVAP